MNKINDPLNVDKSIRFGINIECPCERKGQISIVFKVHTELPSVDYDIVSKKYINMLPNEIRKRGKKETFQLF